MKALALVVLLLLFALPVSAQTSTPLPLPEAQMYEQLATQNASIISTLPADITSPNGSPLLPSNNSSTIFGYAKWMLAPAAADEWAGPFAPIFYNVGIGVYMVFALMGVYGTVYVIGHAGAWIAWLWMQFQRITDLLLQAAQAWPVILILAVILIIAFIVFGQESVQNWIVAHVQDVWNWIQNIGGDLLGR